MGSSNPKVARQRQSSAPRLENVELRNYHLHKRIDQDELSVIYAASHTTLERPVHVAILRRSGWVAAARFQLAGRLAARLSHPHLLPVIDAGHDDQYGDYLVTPALQAQRLSSVLEAGALDPVVALHIFARIASVLDYLHTNGVIHRDIQPTNILIAGDPSAGDMLAYLTNLSLAASPETPADLSSIEEGDYLSPYSAPEQRLDQSEAHPALDIYSLGAVLYHMLWGNIPEGANTVLPSLAATMGDPELKQVDLLLQRMLAEAPAARPKTAGECATMLRRALRQQLDQSTPDMEESRWEPTAEWLPNPLEAVLTSELKNLATTAAPEEQHYIDEIVSKFEEYVTKSRERANQIHRGDAIRRWLNRWSRQGFFRRERVGQLIDFEQVLSYNIYLYSLRVLYETRTPPEIAVRPMTSADRRATGDLVEVWAVEVPETTNFADVSPTRLILPNSLNIITCPQCEGGGQLPCTRCNGEGIITKPRTVRNQDGTTYEDTISAQCPTCRSSGRVNCDQCNGSGNLVEEAFFTWSRRATEFLNTDDIDDLLQPIVLRNHEIEVCSTPINVYGGHWHSVVPLDETLQEAIAAIQDQNTHLIAAELTIKGVPVTEVNYKLNEKDDTLYLIGMSNEVVGGWSLLNPERLALVAVAALLVLLALIWAGLQLFG